MSDDEVAHEISTGVEADQTDCSWREGTVWEARSGT